MPAIRFLCPGCNREMKLDSGHVGRQARCPKCSATFTVPAEGLPAPAAGPAVDAAWQATIEEIEHPATSEPPSQPRRVHPEPSYATASPEAKRSLDVGAGALVVYSVVFSIIFWLTGAVITLLVGEFQANRAQREFQRIQQSMPRLLPQ